MTRRATGPEHVVIDGSAAGKGALVCLNCGSRYALAYPLSLDLMARVYKSFPRDHAKCPKQPNPEAERWAAAQRTDPMTPDEWILSADTGLSAATIWHVLADRPLPQGWRPRTPVDPSDFGRCHRLLERIAGWRERLPEVAERFHEWAPLVREWPHLTSLYLRDLPTGESRELYARLRELQDEALQAKYEPADAGGAGPADA